VSSVIFYGPPGVGKGTQAELTSRNFHMEHLSTGNLLRDEVAEGSELGKQVERIMKAGGLVSDEIVNLMIKKKLKPAIPAAPRFFLTATPALFPKRVF
jgi:adenylate kinase